MDLGSLISNLTADIAEIIGFNINAITTLIFMIMNVIFPFVLIFFINKKLALITMLFLPIQTLVYLVFKKKKKEFHIISKNLDDQYYQYIVDSVDNIPNIK
ncbi:ABC transporter transmembrane domain-containing protein, partial [Sulfuracidifex metallicus]|uniref:ABC transporter transmembrane domain-containing protein n=1 Tax=Sulfuracidifex metallicus TaxID=47303 RepID=UPI0022763568